MKPMCKPKLVSTRLADEVAKKLEIIAVKHRVSLAEYLRWLCEDAARGKYKPSHL